jgi:hypothetical protein
MRKAPPRRAFSKKQRRSSRSNQLFRGNSGKGKVRKTPLSELRGHRKLSNRKGAVAGRDRLVQIIPHPENHTKGIRPKVRLNISPPKSKRIIHLI